MAIEEMVVMKFFRIYVGECGCTGLALPLYFLHLGCFVESAIISIMIVIVLNHMILYKQSIW